MEDNEKQLLIAATTRHSLSTMLRQYMILQLLEGLKLTHVEEWNELLEGTTTKALHIKGSGTLPPCLRRAGDLDITVDMDNPNYRYDVEKIILEHLLKKIAPAMEAQLHLINDDVPLGDKLRRLRKDKKMVMPLIARTFHKEDMPLIKKELERFGITQEELQVLDNFESEVGKVVEARKTAAERKIAARKAEAEKAGKIYTPSPSDYYIPTDEELAGTGLSEVISSEIITKDRLNSFAALTFGAKQLFNDRTQFKDPAVEKIYENTVEGNIGFTHPYEETASKILALITSRNRGSYEETRAKDLIDLFIRTSDTVQTASKAFVHYKVDDLTQVKDMVRVYLPSEPAFHEHRLSDMFYFKKIDPRSSDNIRQVGNGLLALQNHNVIGSAVFGEKITPENARKHAKTLLEHDWKIIESTVGVKAAGSASQPVYTVDTPEAVKFYWQACKRMRKDLELPLSHPNEEMPRIKRWVEELGKKIGDILEADYSRNAHGDGRIKFAGAYSAYQRASQEEPPELIRRPPARSLR